MAKNGTDFANFSDEEEERVIVYGAVKESQPLQSEKLSQTARHERMNSISLIQEDMDDGDDSALIKPDRPDDDVSRTSDQATIAFVNPTIVTTKTYDTGRPWLCHRYCQEKCRIVFASAGLVVVGIGLVGTGIVIWTSTSDFLQAIVFLVIGIILLIPGVYHLIYVYCYQNEATNKPGYSLYDLPHAK